ALNGELSDGARPPYGDNVAGLDIAQLGPHIAGRENVGEKEGLFVRYALWDLQWAHVGERHAGVFGLAASVAAEHVRVAKDARRGVPPQLFHHPGVRVGVLAGRIQLLLTMPAATARDREGHHHTVADLQILHVTA